MTDTQKLLNMRKAIDEAKTEAAQVDGAIKQEFKTMKNSFGISSIAEAKKRIKKLGKQQAELQETLEDGVADLEKKYDW